MNKKRFLTAASIGLENQGMVFKYRKWQAG